MLAIAGAGHLLLHSLYRFPIEHRNMGRRLRVLTARQLQAFLLGLLAHRSTCRR